MIGSVITIVSSVYVAALNWSKMMARTKVGKFMGGNVAYLFLIYPKARPRVCRPTNKHQISCFSFSKHVETFEVVGMYAICMWTCEFILMVVRGMEAISKE